MSKENVEIVRRVMELGQEGIRTDDLRRTMDDLVTTGLVSPTCEWRGGVRGGDAVVGVGDEVGPEGIVEFVRTWKEDFSNFTVEIEDIIDADGDRVVVIQRHTGTGKASGAPVDLRTAFICTLDAGQVVRIAIFLDPRKALEAAGLRG
jgi:ketosteroid isomerase-like protein